MVKAVNKVFDAADGLELVGLLEELRQEGHVPVLGLVAWVYLYQLAQNAD